MSDPRADPETLDRSADADVAARDEPAPSVEPCHDVSQTLWNDTSPRVEGEGSGVGAGDVLAGRFEIRSRIGRGGMGEVFSAHDTVLGETVALKVVHSEAADAERGLPRLRREVQLARKVTHNNVCRIFDLIQHWDDDKNCLMNLVSMELLDGETLRDRRARRGRMALGETLPIVRQIARGLNAAHRHGIVHRDLKPSNVMLVTEEEGVRAAITDFGLARRIGQGARDSAARRLQDLVGTPAYMAPEQIAGEPLSPATDIYSLGLMLYEMLAGRSPFSGGSIWELAAQRVSERPMPIEQHVPGLHPDVCALIERCLARDPNRRFVSTSQVLEVLDFGDATWDIYGRKSPTVRPDEPEPNGDGP